MRDDGNQQVQGGESEPRRRRASYVAAWVGVVLACVLVAGALTGYAAYRDLFGKIHFFDCAPRVLVETLTGIGGRQATCRAQQESHAEPLLELRHGLGDRRLPHAELARSRGE